MSFAPLGAAIAAAQSLNLLSPILLFTRNIGGFVADATVRERHDDELVITEHPVEQGAAITDHSYKRPARVLIEAGWSNSSRQALFGALVDPSSILPNAFNAVVGGALAGIVGNVAASQLTGVLNFTQQTYANFLALQASRQPFTIVTGKRTYTNMLIAHISTETTEKTENALILVVDCKEIIMVATQTVTVPDQSLSKSPATTGATQQTGSKATQPSPQAFNLTSYTNAVAA